MMSIEGIIDRWLADNFGDYWVWSVPEEGLIGWPVRSYITTNDETLLATIVNNKVIPTTKFKDICEEISVHDPQFFVKLEYFMFKAVKRHNK